MYYTKDGTSPDASSSYAVSGELIVLEESTTLRAVAAFEDRSFDAFSSTEVEATFIVHTGGMIGLIESTLDHGTSTSFHQMKALSPNMNDGGEENIANNVYHHSYRLAWLSKWSGASVCSCS